MDPFLWAAVFVLAVSFISNVSPFFGASYTLLATLQLTLLGFTPFNFVAVVVLSAIGATLAKVVIYYGAFGFRDLLLRNKNVRLIGRSASSPKFYAALFVTALMPVLPLDDFIYIGAGASSTSIGLMTAITYAAKTIKSLVEVALEFTILSDLRTLFNFRSIDVTVVLTSLFLVIGVLVYQVDWEAAYRRLVGRPMGADGSTVASS